MLSNAEDSFRPFSFTFFSDEGKGKHGLWGVKLRRV